MVFCLQEKKCVGVERGNSYGEREYLMDNVGRLLPVGTTGTQWEGLSPWSIISCDRGVHCTPCAREKLWHNSLILVRRKKCIRTANHRSVKIY